MDQPSSVDDITGLMTVDCETVVRELEQHGAERQCCDETIERIALHIENCVSCRAVLDSVAPERTLLPLNGRLGREARALISAMDLDADEHAAVAALLLVEGGGDMTTSDEAVAGSSCEVVVLSEVREGMRPTEPVRAPDGFSGQFLPGVVLSGSVGTYVIKGLKKSNDFSETYDATVQGFLAGSDVQEQTRVIVRIPRVTVDMSDQAAISRLGLLAGLLEADAVAARRLSGSEHVAQLLDRGEYNHRLIANVSPSVFVVYRYVEGYNLMEWMNAEHRGQFTGIAHAKDFFSWARKLTAAVLDMHQRLVIHGDICPSNIIVDRKHGNPVFVDFGQSVFVHAMNGLDIYRGHPYRAPEETKTPSTDLFSLGGVLYFLATGSDPHGLGFCAGIEQLKQQVEDKIREVNPRLFDDEAGVVDVIARCLRKHSRVQHASHLLQDIETFEPTIVPGQLVDEVAQLSTVAGELDAAGNALFHCVAAQRMHILLETLKDMGRGVLDFSGESKDICSAACALNSALGEGDEFFATSLPMFWYPGNMGINGRFLTTTRMAAARGVHIQRLLILDSDLADEHLEQILAAQRKVTADLRYSRNYSVKYIVMTPEARRRFVREGNHFGLYVRQGDCMAMFPVYSEDGKLVTMRFRTAETIVHGLRGIFESLARSASPLPDLQLPIRARTAGAV